MHFGFDADQVAFQDAVRALLAKRATPADLRAAWVAPAGELDRALWSELADMGVLATVAPKVRGGLGLDERSLVLVLEEIGRAAVAHPVAESAAVAAPLLGAEQQGAMVASNLGGPHVSCGADADLLLLVDPEGRRLHLVEPAEVALQTLVGVDRGRRLAQLKWQPRASTAITDDPAEIALAVARGTAATAAVLVGLGQTMLDMTVRYVNERQQFGVAVGSFQAVKHHLADALRELSFARVATQRAAWSIATGASTRDRDVSMAKAMASTAATLTGRHALQCHGAIGYTVEHDLHLYLKRTWALSRAWGDTEVHRRNVAQAVLGGPFNRPHPRDTRSE